jgi:Domain of unknown function (DUF4129)
VKMIRFTFRRRLARVAAYRFAIVILIVAGWASASFALAADAAHPMSRGEYQAELRRVEKAIQDQRDHATPAAGRAETLAVEIPDVWYVEAQGQRYEVPTSELKFTLADNAGRAAERVVVLNADIDRIHALEEEAKKLESTSQEASQDPARAKLEEILNRKEFNQAHEKKSWLGELWDKVLRWVVNLLDKLFEVVRGNKPVRSIVLYGVIVVGFFALVWILVRVLGGVARRENLRLEAPAFPVKTSGQWVREATAAAAHGNYREAIHCGYWAGVYRLSEMGIWELEESRTPREYLRLLSAGPREDAAFGVSLGSSSVTGAVLPDPATRAARAQALSALTRSFESVWYADEPATQQDFVSAVAHLEKLECRLPSTAPTAGL